MTTRSQPPALDFKVVPLARGAALLQEAGEAQLRALLNGHAPTPLARLLGREQIRLLTPPLGLQLWALLPARLVKRLPWVPGAPTRTDRYVLGQVVVAGRPAAMWRAHVLQRVERALGRISPHFLPLEFWPLAAEMAWREPGFQHRTAELLRENLRGRILWTRGRVRSAPLPLVEPNTFWALLALAGAGNPARQLFKPRRMAILGALTRFHGLAVEQASAPGWAGFWDQWILIEASQRWSATARDVAEPLRSALAALPLKRLAQVSEALEGAPAAGVTGGVAAPGWEAEVPLWFPVLSQAVSAPRHSPTRTAAMSSDGE